MFLHISLSSITKGLVGNPLGRPWKHGIKLAEVGSRVMRAYQEEVRVRWFAGSES